MYVDSDPRSRIAQAVPVKAQPVDFGTAYYGKFYETEPQIVAPGEKTWYARGQNFLIAYSEAEVGAALARTGQPDEYAVLLPDRDSEIEVRWASTARTVKGPAVAFVPPGDSTIKTKTRCRIARFFTVRSDDLVARCVNGPSAYVEDPNVAPLQLWPEPKDGFQIRAYSLDVAPSEKRFGRIFRCTTFMINFLEPRHGQRDPAKMSPHSHDDFQQCSLCLEGTFVHHLRWPWIPDMRKWREDEHEHCAAPSVAFIPARIVHTSESKEPGLNQLVDIFCPPRFDFSAQDGWVLNADDYPMPSNV